ncbi:MAG TPA: alpha/beta hydrolase [Blastocatellia bacterium]|nr:alpha/beta hydrolase [Blastocatellia bacterium]
MKFQPMALIAVVATLFSLPLSDNVAAQSFDKTGKTVRGADSSLVPGFPDVIGEYLQIAGTPSPGTPAELATATFLRLRLAADGETPKPANAVIVAMPGFASTPPHWLYLASQLVHKGAQRSCEDKSPCRVEVWIVQRRGANLADTAGAKLARAKKAPELAAEYYFGSGVLSLNQQQPGKWPDITPQKLLGRPGSRWQPLQQKDLTFMADWGFETYAGDVDRMIALAKQQVGAKNIFLAGHSQGGGFVAAYAGRMQADGKRGYEKLAGLIFLDGGPSAGAASPVTPAQTEEYFSRVEKMRKGEASVFTDSGGLLGNLAGPVPAALNFITGVFFGLKDPDAESIFPARAGAAAQAGDGFLSALRLTYRARAGMSFDVDPVNSAGLQNPLVARLGEGLGQLDFKPLPGTEGKCDPLKAAPPCVPTAEQLDPKKVYGWQEGGGNGQTANRVGKAQLWLDALGFAPARSNIKPVTLDFAVSGKRTIDASQQIAFNWYASERYESDMRFVGQYRTFKLQERGVNLDVDKAAIENIPVYVARQSQTANLNNPFSKVVDFTELNKKGTFQTDAAKQLTPFDSGINVALYFHTDFVSADDSLEGKGTPGRPGISAVSNTLIDWVLKRSRGRAAVPAPKQLGVTKTY